MNERNQPPTNGQTGHGADSGAASRPLAAVILAAGRGTRMGSGDLPKVAHVVAGRPMISWVVDAARRAKASPIVLVVGHRADVVRDIFAGDDADLRFATQDRQLGTGHATLCAEPELAHFDGDVLVLAGDGPLIRAGTIEAIRRRHAASSAAATLATSIIDDPTGYGRIVRDGAGRFSAIVEHRNASEQQRAIREIYPSYACFDAARLFEALHALEPDAVSGEHYLTEVPAMLQARGLRVEAVDAVPPEDVLSINTPAQLAEVESILSARSAASP